MHAAAAAIRECPNSPLLSLQLSSLAREPPKNIKKRSTVISNLFGKLDLSFFLFGKLLFFVLFGKTGFSFYGEAQAGQLQTEKKTAPIALNYPPDIPPIQMWSASKLHSGLVN